MGVAGEPTFKEFLAATRRPMRQGAATVGIPTRVWQLLPYYVMWMLYLGDSVGMEGRHNADPLGGGKSNIAVQKRGDNRGTNCRPIFVNSLRYLAFMKIVDWRHATKIMQSLDEYHYVVKGRTATNV